MRAARISARKNNRAHEILPTARKITALLLLLALPAWADDAPRKLNAFQVQSGYVVTEEGAWLYTAEGKRKVDARIQADAQWIAQLEEANAALGAQPALTLKGGLLLAGGGLALGLAAGFILGAIVAPKR